MPSPSRSRGWPRPVGAVVAIAAVAGVLLGTSLPSALAAHPEDRVSAPGRIIPGRIVVRWKSATTPAGRSSARDHARLVGASSLGSKDFQVLTVPAGTQPAAALRALRADPRVAAAEPDRYLATFGTPDDPSLPQQWAIQNTGAPIQGFAGAKVGGDIDVVPAWDRTVGTPQTVVAVIDTGYDFLNPDLGEVAWTNPGEIPGNGIDDDANGKIDDVHGWDFVGANIDTPVEDADPTDDDALGGGHGLHVAGIIGAKGNDGHGITGVAQNVRLMPLRVCTWSQKDNASECSLSAVVSAINYAGQMGAKVANLSLGGPQFSQVMVDAFAANPHTLYVVAAGNYAENDDSYPTYPCKDNPRTDSTIPGRVDNVVCVAASDQADKPASFTNWGPKSVDLAAPGVNIYSLYSQGVIWSDDFNAADFAQRWTSSGLGFGRGMAGDGNLTSPGLTDSPGGPPQAGHHQVDSVPFQIPENVETCRIQGDRYARIGDGSAFDYALLVDGQRDPNLVFGPVDSTVGVMRAFQTTPFDGTAIAGKAVSLEFTYDAAAGLDNTFGVWWDNLKLVCARTSAQPALYSFLSGTSMSSPMVAGAAALLYSLDPTASVAQVRAALIGGAKKLPAWRGLTVSGGRLDVAASMGRLVPPDTEFLGAPVVNGQSVTLDAGQNGSLGGITFGCRIDTGRYRHCNPHGIVRGVHPGRHLFFIRAIDPYGNVDPTPATAPFTITGCLVPRLVGGSLAQARVALARAGCELGKVVRPARVPVGKLRVAAVSARTGTYLRPGTGVTLVLARR